MGKRPGSQNYTPQDGEALLTHGLQLVPVDKHGWQRVAERYNQEHARQAGRSERTGPSLKIKFRSLASSKCMYSAEWSRCVALARKLRERIERRVRGEWFAVPSGSGSGSGPRSGSGSGSGSDVSNRRGVAEAPVNAPGNASVASGGDATGASGDAGRGSSGFPSQDDCTGAESCCAGRPSPAASATGAHRIPVCAASRNTRPSVANPRAKRSAATSQLCLPGEVRPRKARRRHVSDGNVDAETMGYVVVATVFVLAPAAIVIAWRDRGRLQRPCRQHVEEEAEEEAEEESMATRMRRLKETMATRMRRLEETMRRANETQQEVTATMMAIKVALVPRQSR